MTSTTSNELIKKFRDIIEKGGSIDANTRDVLLFTAIIDVNTQLEMLQPVLTFYKIGMWFVAILAAAVFGLLWGLLTGQVQIVVI